MPRYDDRYGNTRLYVGHLSSRTRTRDLERLFSRYGRVRDVDMKRDYAFVEFSDPRDADDARHYLDGRDYDGSRIVVEFSRGAPRGSRDSRDGGGRAPPPPGSGRCFNCGVDGHWARDCTAGDWKNKCYRCGERGHIERNCKNSPKKIRGGGSYSRSPVRSRSPRRRRSPSRSRSRSVSRSRSRSRSRSYSRGHSYSRSRSPVNNDRSRSPRAAMVESRSPRDSPSPREEHSPLKPVGGGDISPSSPKPRNGEEESSDYDKNGRNDDDHHVVDDDDDDDDRSPVEDDYDVNHRSPT